MKFWMLKLMQLLSQQELQKELVNINKSYGKRYEAFNKIHIVLY